MIRLDVEQGSPEWLHARLGLPTASKFDSILTPKQRKYASGADTYRNSLLAEWVLGYPIDSTGSNEWMERGVEMEKEARAYYEFGRDVEVERVGFLLRDDERVGGSPDGLVGEDGGLEIKCPLIHTHVGYLLDPDSLVANYVGQVQGNLYLTGREWWDLLAYNPELPAVLVRVPRDEAYIKDLDAALDRFLAELDAGRKSLAPHRKNSILLDPAFAGIGA